MIPFLYAWVIGEGIIITRWIRAKAPPPPGALLAPAGLFLGLAIIAQEPRARPVVTAFAFAVDLAILLQVVGHNPAPETGWPPPSITDATVLLPGGSASTGNTAQPAASTAAATPPPATGGTTTGTGTTLV